MADTVRVATRFLMAYFKPGEYVLFGKFKNKKGKIIRIYIENGIPKIEIEPIKGRKKTRIMGLYTIRKMPPEAIAEAKSLERTAARPISINPREIDEVMSRFREWALKHNQDEPASEDFLTFTILKSPDGNAVPIAVAFLPGHDIAGGFGRMNGAAVVKVFFDKRMHYRGLAEPYVQKELRSVLLHELTHAIEIKSPIREHSPIREQSPTLKDIGPAKEYYNDPSEVRAYMRQLYEQVRDEVRDRMKSPLAQRWGLAKIITVALRSKPAWRQMEHHLTSANRNRILKGIVTAIQDEASYA